MHTGVIGLSSKYLGLSCINTLLNHERGEREAEFVHVTQTAGSLSDSTPFFLFQAAVAGGGIGQSLGEGVIVHRQHGDEVERIVQSLSVSEQTYRIHEHCGMD